MMKYLLLVIFCIIGWACAFKPSYSFNAVHSIKVLTVTRKFDRSYIKRFSTEKSSSDNNEDDIDETTKKYGLEAGLFKAITSKDEVTNELKPKQLLAKYGIAYLVTSISLALVSFSLCYILVSNGVDVASILTKFGIESSVTAANAGTFALAYAVHKAASPIRFPPTVFLTPIVAGLIGKGTEKK
jgi:hypothetical protein